MEKLNRVQNAQFWGLKTYGQGGGRAPGLPPPTGSEPAGSNDPGSKSKVSHVIILIKNSPILY